MTNSEQAIANATLPMEEVTRYHQQNTTSNAVTTPEGTLITPENENIVPFNGYYGLNITSGNYEGAEGAFFTIDTNMYVTPSGTAYYLQFILSLDGKSSVKIPFTGTFTELESGDYELNQNANGVSGTAEIALFLTFSRSQNVTTAELNGKIVIAAPNQGETIVNGATYNNPILPATYIGNYYDSSKNKALIIGENNALQYKAAGSTVFSTITNYKFNLNMYVFSFISPDDSSDTISLVMGTSPNSGLVCGDLKSKTVGKSDPTQRTLNTIQSPPISVAPTSLNSNGNKLAPFSAYYSTDATTGAFIAIQANVIPLVGSADIYEVMIGFSTDGITSTVHNFDKTMSFDESTNTLQIPNPAHASDATAPQYILDVSFTRQYVKNGMSGQLIQLQGHVMGNPVSGNTPFNLIPLSGFMGAPLTNSDGEQLIVTSNSEVTYKGKPVGEYQTDNILYVPIMYILEFTNPAPITPVAGEVYKVVCSFGTDAEQGLACIVTEYTLKGNVVQNQAISYYHSVPA